MITGYVFARLKVLPECLETNLIQFLFYVAVPSIMFGTIAEQNLKSLLNLPFIAIFGAATGVVFVIAITGSLVSQKRGLGALTMVVMPSVVSNTAIIGLPLLHSLLGKPGVVLASLANIMIVFFLLIEVAFLETAKASSRAGSHWAPIKNTVLNPIVLSTLLGVAYAVMPLPLPKIASNFFDLLGSAVAPCALFAVGMSLRPRSLIESGAQVLVLSGLKLIVLPFLALGLVLFFKTDPLVAVCIVLCAGLPTAKNQFILADKYHESEELVANMVSFTTVVSVVTLLLWLLLLADLYPGLFSK